MSVEEQIREIMSFVLMDGQNQIYDLKDGNATPEQVTERMFASLDYHMEKVKPLIEAERIAGGIEELEKIAPAYDEYYQEMSRKHLEYKRVTPFTPFHQIINNRLAELRKEQSK